MQATEQYIYDDSIYVKYLKLYVGMYANTYKKERNFEIVGNFHDRIYSYATYEIKQTSENSGYIGFRLVHYVFSMQLGTKLVLFVLDLLVSCQFLRQIYYSYSLKHMNISSNFQNTVKIKSVNLKKNSGRYKKKSLGTLPLEFFGIRLSSLLKIILYYYFDS